MKSLDYLLKYAARAASVYNSQPWQIYMLGKSFILSPDYRRVSPKYTPLRDIYISLGCFTEAFALAAASFGYTLSTQIIKLPKTGSEVIKIDYEPTVTGDPYILDLISTRKTVRDNYSNDTLSQADYDLLAAGNNKITYFESGSDAASVISTTALGTISVPVHWIRYSSDEEILTSDGLSLESFGISHWYGNSILNKLTPKIVRDIYNDKIIELKCKHMREGAGWLVMWDKANTPQHWVETGRKFYRMALGAQMENIAIHPVSSILKYPQEYEKITKLTGGEPHMVLRTGYITEYGVASSLRLKININKL